VFSWISLSIHLGGVKWIIISDKDFDIPGWIKRFLCICNYVEELLWFWNQKFSSCMIQVCFYKSPICKECLVMVSKAMLLLATSSVHIFVKRGTIAYQNWNFFCSLRYLDVFHACHLKICLRTLLLWVDHEILDLQEDPSFQSYSLFPLVQLSNNHEGRKWSFVMSWINIFNKEDHRGINKIVED
jgi:hypothetical protein